METCKILPNNTGANKSLMFYVIIITGLVPVCRFEQLDTYNSLLPNGSGKSYTIYRQFTVLLMIKNETNLVLGGGDTLQWSVSYEKLAKIVRHINQNDLYLRHLRDGESYTCP